MISKKQAIENTHNEVYRVLDIIKQGKIESLPIEIKESIQDSLSDLITDSFLSREFDYKALKSFTMPMIRARKNKAEKAIEGYKYHDGRFQMKLRIGLYKWFEQFFNYDPNEELIDSDKWVNDPLSGKRPKPPSHIQFSVSREFHEYYERIKKDFQKDVDK